MPPLRTMPWALRTVAVLAALGAVGAAALLFVGVPSCQTPGPTRPPGPPPEADLSRTDVVLHPQSGLREGRNAVWCASIQLAWDALADEVGTDGRLELGPPAPAAAVEALNRRTFPHDDLDAASVVAEAVRLEDPGSADRLRRRLEALSIAPPPALARLGAGDVLAFAVLRKDLPFAEPFVVHPRRLAFAGGPRRVVTFGLDEDDRGDRVARIARQAVLHEGEWKDGEPPDRIAVELLPRDAGDRIVLALLPRPATLDDAWAAASALLERRPGRPLSAGSELVVPKVDFTATRRFSELEAPVGGALPGTRVVEAVQRIELTLSEAGARLFSTATIATALSARAPPPVFDGPFLLALLRRGASRPYLVAWFENDDLFVKD